MRITLAAARVNAGLTQKELAEKMKVSNKTVGNWETGKIEIPYAQLHLFCEICGVSIENVKRPEI